MPDTPTPSEIPASPAVPQAVPAEAPLGRKSKNIVVFCDGTGNEFGDENSNVVKLYTACTIDNDQVGYYHPGVGTMGDPGARHWLSNKWSVIKGLAFASGFKDNVLDAYKYLMETFDDGDRVYIFGFSRGSYTARALAGLLDGYGLLCKGNEGHIPYAWRLYTDKLKDRSQHSLTQTQASAAFKETFSRKDFTIHFIGLWDTVSSVGWISTPLRLYNIAQNHAIQTGRHAISIDERRCFYLDNLWGDPLPNQDIQQVWFAGVHSDVGGSYPQTESGLPNITLDWMIQEARNAGLLLEEDRVAMVLGTPSKDYPHSSTLYNPPDHPAIVHPSLKGVWWILELLPHLYYDKDDGHEQRRIPFGSWRDIPNGALVHHTVMQRLQDKKLKYSPKNVKPENLVAVAAPGGAPPMFYTFVSHRKKKGDFGRRALFITVSAVEIALAIAIFLLIDWGVRWLWRLV